MNATYTVEIKDSKAVALLKNLEDLNLIKLLSNGASKTKLSEKLKGKISVQESNELNNFSKNSREKW